jgi:elongation factor 1 alpha-like protein
VLFPVLSLLTPTAVAKAKEPRSKSLPAKQRVQSQSGSASRTGSQSPSSRTASAASTPQKKGVRTPNLSAAQYDMAALHLGEDMDEEELAREQAKFLASFVPSMKQEEIIAKVIQQEEASGKKNISLVVIGE